MVRGTAVSPSSWSFEDADCLSKNLSRHGGIDPSGRGLVLASSLMNDS
jgi:hypothetical protein